MTDEKTLLEALAIACLKGDLTAGYAIVDRLIEMRDNPDWDRARQIREKRICHPEQDRVYHWPEFQAFAKRLGILWHLGTTTLIIKFAPFKAVEVTHSYLAADQGEQPPDSYDTTTDHNQTFRTRELTRHSEEV